MAQGFAKRVTAFQWEDWSPAYTNLTIGNGTVISRFINIGKLVVCHFTFTLGSTSAVGTTPKVSLPVVAASVYVANRNYVGELVLDDITGSDFHGPIRLASTSEATLLVYDSSGTYLGRAGITATVPFTWATGDIISFTMVYEGAT